TPNKVANKCSGNHHRTWRDHPNGNGDQELVFIHPSVLLNQTLLEKRHNNEPTAERERPCLEKEQQKFRQSRAGRRWCQLKERRQQGDLQESWRKPPPDVAVGDDAYKPGAEKQ